MTILLALVYFGGIFTTSHGRESEQTCAAFDFQPLECRQNGCTYFCHDHMCQPTTGHCGCDQHCHNECGCILDNCEYNILTSMCMSRKKICRPEDLIDSECMRERSIYFTTGIVCMNKWEKGTCSVKTLQAVNFGGRTESVNGITYKSDKDREIQDILVSQAYQSLKGTLGDHSLIPAKDRAIHETYVEAALDTCVGIMFDLNKHQEDSDGVYEWVLQITQFNRLEVEKRLFSIKLHTLELTRAFNPLAYTLHSNPIQIVIPFRIMHMGNQKHIEVWGYEQLHLEVDPLIVRFEVCPAVCTGPNVNHKPIISAMYVAKYN